MNADPLTVDDCLQAVYAAASASVSLADLSLLVERFAIANLTQASIFDPFADEIAPILREHLRQRNLLIGSMARALSE
jgi:hypothetical protein